jgi:hypothetical protein
MEETQKSLLRKKLYPSEDEYFRKNPNVAGMATEDERVILNPYSPKDVNKDAVYKNEAARIYMRKSKERPTFAVTEQQKQLLAGTTYENASEQDQRETIVGRILSQDPSAGQATPEQLEYAQKITKQMNTVKPSRSEKNRKSPKTIFSKDQSKTLLGGLQ